MKIIIYHVSNTGCGLYVIKRLKPILEKEYDNPDIEVRHINPILRSVKLGQKFQQQKADLVILHSFADFFQVAKPMVDFIQLLDIKDTKVATFDTSGGYPGVLKYQFQNLVVKKGGIFAGHFTGIFVSNNFHKPKNGKAMTINPKQFNELEKYVKNIKNTNIIQPTKQCRVGLTQSVFSCISRHKSILGGKLQVDHEKCTGCQKCVNNCPGNVFDYKNNKAIVTRWEDCYACACCIHNCGAQAIQAIGSTKPYQQFKFEEYYLNEKKGYVDIEQLKKEAQKSD